MAKVTFFKTKMNNKYIYSFNKKHILLSNNYFEKFYKADQNKTMHEGNIRNAKENNYYKEKYELLKKVGFFENLSGQDYLCGKINNNVIESELSNLSNLVFEITEKCNLKCTYCFYGENYSQYAKRKQFDLKLKDAYGVLEYLIPKWNSSLNISPEKEIFIGFYGGEPLLNISFIENVVKYIHTVTKNKFKFKFAITTNGVLLNKHINYLVKNNFSLTISIDGNKKNNSYRVFHDGKPSFDHVRNNILLIKKNFPEFFKTNVMLNAVLHDRNNLLEANKYTMKYFGKRLLGNVVNPLLDNKQFNYLGHDHSLKTEEHINYFISSEESQHFSRFLRNFSLKYFENYNSIFEIQNIKFTPTGTCLPFNKKLFITAQGLILPCETIGHQFALGQVNEGKVILDERYIANLYNVYFNQLISKCNTCYRINFCTDCLFLNLIQKNNKIRCKYLSEKEHRKFLADYYSFFENHPSIFKKIWGGTRYA